MAIRNANLPDGEYFIYLRKSRADLEAEAKGEGETLAKHRRALYRLAKDLNVTITQVFPEIESGESILHRPEMVKMLKAMEDTPPKGILVMDIDRLGRGDKIDQGIIERSFKESKALIITPSEIFDMNEESGEFNVEVRSFVARLELKQTTKRLQGGRRRSVKDDRNYIGTRPPYGYLLHKDDTGRTLIPNPEQAPVVKMIFELYTQSDPKKRMGSNKIAGELNRLNYKTYTGKPWESSTVLFILKNEVYAGRLQWGKKDIRKSKVPGKKRDTKTRDREEWIDVEGRYEPLISKEVFNRAQEILKGKYHVPYQLVNGITNPLAGLIKCDMCGMSMVLRPYTNQQAHLMCYNQLCPNKSSRFAYVEEKLLFLLGEWLKDYKLNYGKKSKVDNSAEIDIKMNAIKSMERELKELDTQKLNLHDFLERKIYDEETYLTRSKNIADRFEAIKESIEMTKLELKAELNREKAQKEVIPSIESVLKLYQRSKQPEKKNDLLKSVLQYAVYRKEKTQRNKDFALRIVPKTVVKYQ